MYDQIEMIFLSHSVYCLKGKNKRFAIGLDPGPAMHNDSGYTKIMVR